MSSSYRVSTEWIGKRNGFVKAEPVATPLSFSAPPQFGGTEGQWTPEHLLLASVASCYVATFTAIAEINHFQFEGLKVTCEAELIKVAGGMRFATITIRPRLTLADETKRDQAQLLLEKSKKACIISRSLAAEVAMEAEIDSQEQPTIPQLVF
jgi:peroxiredoxin-like protein